jgi:hypothetical protein
MVALAMVLVAGPRVHAQELEPRAYSPSPVGMNFAGLAYSYSSGGVATDATLPLDNVEVTLRSAILSYVRTFDLFGRTASGGVSLPYTWGQASGEVFETHRVAQRSGTADARLRLTVNLLGGPALDRAQFAAQQRSTQVGASLTVVAPTGEYDSRQLVNLGSNRWSVKPEIGVYQPLGHWSLECAAGAWFFGDNDDFYGGQRREQDPVGSLQGHVGYTFRPRLWAAVDYTYYWGGESTLDGVRKNDRISSSRAGVVVSVPLGVASSMKLAWSNGVTTRLGADFTTYGVSFQQAW